LKSLQRTSFSKRMLAFFLLVVKVGKSRDILVQIPTKKKPSRNGFDVCFREDLTFSCHGRTAGRGWKDAQAGLC
jgi:hypothetical protein